MQYSIPHAQGTIAVAVSGGADSLHTLLTLKQAGYDVIALHGLFGQHLLEEFVQSAGLQKSTPVHTELVEKLAEICSTLGIPFHVIDCSKEFLQQVITPFVRTYAASGTPNPCALCNATIKFGALLDAALQCGATHLATGHYAKLVYPGNFASGNFPALIQGDDPLKDQSYFLALTPLSCLEKLLFPLGTILKSDVLATLAAQGIRPPQRGESQEVCFIPGNAYRAFLPFMAKKLGIALPSAGPMALVDGTVVGTHKGLWQYTEGQRKGLGVAWKEPLHVLKKTASTNTLLLGAKGQMHIGQVECGSGNLLLPPEAWPEELFVKVRYRTQLQKAQVHVSTEGSETMIKIIFATPESSVAAGQLAVVYAPFGTSEKNAPTDMRVVGGGIITSAW